MSLRLRNLNPYDLHKTLINEYFLTAKERPAWLKRDTSKDKRDIDVIKENHQFLWEEEDKALSWEKRLAKKYYDKLYKEYCIVDLSRYKENKFGMRWRTESELISGKGQFSCGNKKCDEKENLRTWEVNFGYVEHGVKKNALVKLRLCSDCSDKLNYHHKKKEIKRLKTQRPSVKESSRQSQDKSRSECNEKSGNEDEVEQSDSTKISDSEKSCDNDVWSQNQPKEEEEEKTREQEFDEYLDQLFL